MKLCASIFCCCLCLCCASLSSAQSTTNNHQRTISETLDSWISHTENLVVPAADAMPAEKYSFAPPTTFGDFAGVRTFAQQLKHLAANNYRMAALIREQKPSPEMEHETGPDSAVTKSQIMDYLKGSFAALHQAAATINDHNALEPIASPSQWQHNRVSFAIDSVMHDMDHYGQLVEYLRMNGITPPESRPQSR